MVVGGVCIVLVSVPLIALLAVRLTSNQFVRETEQSLIQQGAIHAALYADVFKTLPGDIVGTPLSEDQKKHWNSDLHPARSTLNVRAETVLPPRPEGEPVASPLSSRYAAVAGHLLPIARQAQRTTLSGVVFLSHDGRSLNDTEGRDLSNLVEVQTALAGDIGRALRFRGDSYQLHSLASISRDTRFRVFVAYPVIVDDHVVGAVYLSRTPLNLGKFVYEERVAFFIIFAAMAVAAGVIGWVLVRLISRPVIGLRNEAQAVAAGTQDHAQVLPHYGFRELATLGESVEKMASTLTKRSHEITTYTDHVTHELKSPVTAIIGAAELLQSDGVGANDRDKLLTNVAAEGHRMAALLDSLRAMTRLKTMTLGEAGRLGAMIPNQIGLDIIVDAPAHTVLPLTIEHGRIILSHMAQNAHAHNAGLLKIHWDNNMLSLMDDGDGVDAANVSRLAEPFFTTRRETGGTGMGLSICQAILDGYGASLHCVTSDEGAHFQIRF